MLVLSRKAGDTIQIATNIEVKVLEVKGDTVRIGIEAPRSIEIVRGELLQSITEENTEALAADLSWLPSKKEQ